MRREHLIGLVAVINNALREDFVVGEYGHGFETKDG